MTKQNAVSTLLAIARDAKTALSNSKNTITVINGEIRAFGKYTIRKVGPSYQVYRFSSLVVEPSSKQIAISWCVADKYNSNVLSEDLIQGDIEITNQQNNLVYYNNALKKTTEIERRYILLDRIQQSTIRLATAQAKIIKAIELAKYWQQKGFSNELNRF